MTRSPNVGPRDHADDTSQPLFERNFLDEMTIDRLTGLRSEVERPGKGVHIQSPLLLQMENLTLLYYWPSLSRVDIAQ